MMNPQVNYVAATTNNATITQSYTVPANIVAGSYNTIIVMISDN